MAKKKRKRFNSEKNAKLFALKVDGKLNDLRGIKGAKSQFSVTYKGSGVDKRGLDYLSPYEWSTEFWQ